MDIDTTKLYTIDFPYKSVVLNSEQYKVVTANPYEHQRILASAGSGKTTTITARISHLITTHSVKPEQIVLLTFSRNASREMIHRVHSLVGPVKIWSGTFHGLAKQVLSLYDTTSHSNYFVDEFPARLLSWFLTSKGREWVGKLRYVIVDEFQDINDMQWRLLQAMQHFNVRLTIVGDDAQNIYTWRGSSSGYLLNLHHMIKSVKDYQLRQNYRSTEAIVAVANSVMRGIPTLDWKENMISFKKGGTKPEVMFFWRFHDECMWVAKLITQIKKENPLASIAVLSRNNTNLYYIEERLLEEGHRPQILVLDSSEESDQKRNSGRIALSTFHGSKGLEWDVVFCICLTDDQLPSRKRPEDILMDRRLFYVAVTRAKERLFLSYNGNERKLSRFVREIGHTLLTFYGLAKYALSDIELGEQVPTLEGLIDCLDGDEWQLLRKNNLLPFKESEALPISSTKLFPLGETWRIPEWTEAASFESFVSLFIKRCMYQQGSDTVYHDPMRDRMIFTLRIYQEDKEFWEEWREVIYEMVKHFFKDSSGPPPAEFPDIDAWQKKKGCGWSQQDTVHATTILAKLRGQLRPLRFETYSLDEFTICPARTVVPTEYRPHLLRSWRNFQKKGMSWKDCLVDIWTLSCLDQVSEGRNAGLFKISSIKHLLADCIPFFEMIERSILLFGQGVGVKQRERTLNPEIIPEGLSAVSVDCCIENTLLRICGERKPDIYLWLESCLIAYLFSVESQSVIDKIQILHPFYGVLWSLDVPDKAVLQKLYKVLFDIWTSKQVV